MMLSISKRSLLRLIQSEEKMELSEQLTIMLVVNVLMNTKSQLLLCLTIQQQW
jgi:hypothetical protein